MNTRLALLLPLMLIPGCSSERQPPPQPAPRPQPAPVRLPPPAPAPTPPQPGFADLRRTPGEWVYSPGPAGSHAAYVSGGRSLFSINCSRLSRRMWLERDGVVPDATAMTVQTSYGSRRLAARGPAAGFVPGEPVAEQVAAMVADVGARDPLLDQMIFSRGHFAVDVPGLARLVLPAWAEPARVVEDCRK